ncbi:MAG TPA: 30S ribosomal protein S30 [Syntrophobacteraceae bacterium]|nr:30S ribosomal protein S30 [Syntrophobacteraceae bacterium]HBZ55820.1 30S ribosomal protein S30 [Syntrophobacteraceae bacterium]
MRIPLQITSRDIELPESIETVIREKADKLKTFNDQIIGCRVVVETPHRSRQKGIFYNVNIELSVPGSDLVVKREAHMDLTAAIRDAFDAARRQLQDYSRRQRGEIKVHEEAPYGRVHSLFPEDGYGFLMTMDGREIYFHENSVVDNKFRKLAVGTEVRFAESNGDKGPQASTVIVV